MMKLEAITTARRARPVVDKGGPERQLARSAITAIRLARQSGEKMQVPGGCLKANAA